MDHAVDTKPHLFQHLLCDGRVESGRAEERLPHGHPQLVHVVVDPEPPRVPPPGWVAYLWVLLDVPRLHECGPRQRVAVAHDAAVKPLLVAHRAAAPEADYSVPRLNPVAGDELAEPGAAEDGYADIQRPQQVREVRGLAAGEQ